MQDSLAGVGALIKGRNPQYPELYVQELSQCFSDSGFEGTSLAIPSKVVLVTPPDYFLNGKSKSTNFGLLESFALVSTNSRGRGLMRFRNWKKMGW